jgi:hypothetical protein
MNTSESPMPHLEIPQVPPETVCGVWYTAYTMMYRTNHVLAQDARNIRAIAAEQVEEIKADETDYEFHAASIELAVVIASSQPKMTVDQFTTFFMRAWKEAAIFWNSFENEKNLAALIEGVQSLTHKDDRMDEEKPASTVPDLSEMVPEMVISAGLLSRLMAMDMLEAFKKEPGIEEVN